MIDAKVGILSWEDTARLCILGYSVGDDMDGNGGWRRGLPTTSMGVWSGMNPRRFIKGEITGSRFSFEHIARIRRRYDEGIHYRSQTRSKEDHRLDHAFSDWRWNLPIVNYEQAKEWMRQVYDIDFVIEPRIMDKKEYICRMLGSAVRNDFCGPFDTPSEAIVVGLREAMSQLPRIAYPISKEELTDVDYEEETEDQAEVQESGICSGNWSTKYSCGS